MKTVYTALVVLALIACGGPPQIDDTSQEVSASCTTTQCNPGLVRGDPDTPCRQACGEEWGTDIGYCADWPDWLYAHCQQACDAYDEWISSPEAVGCALNDPPTCRQFPLECNRYTCLPDTLTNCVAGVRP